MPTRLVASASGATIHVNPAVSGVKAFYACWPNQLLVLHSKYINYILHYIYICQNNKQKQENGLKYI